MCRRRHVDLDDPRAVRERALREAEAALEPLAGDDDDDVVARDAQVRARVSRSSLKTPRSRAGGEARRAVVDARCLAVVAGDEIGPAVPVQVAGRERLRVRGVAGERRRRRREAVPVADRPRECPLRRRSRCGRASASRPPASSAARRGSRGERPDDVPRAADRHDLADGSAEPKSSDAELNVAELARRHAVGAALRDGRAAVEEELVRRAVDADDEVEVAVDVHVEERERRRRERRGAGDVGAVREREVRRRC